MTKCCTPVQLNISLKACIIVFIIQMVTLGLFLAEAGLTAFVPIERGSTGIRLICSLLVHIKIYEEVQQALYILRYLKYVKTAKGGKRGRLLNIMLCLL